MCRVAVFVALASVLAMPPARAQSTSQQPHKRRVLVQIPAEYPILAKRMRVTGNVKLEVTVRPNGEVKSCRVIGGHPLLVDPAVAAVGRWKFETLQNETTETVQINFEQP